MKLLEERIRRDGEIKSGDILKVDRFLNHQMDPALFYAMAEEWKRLFDGCTINKILTIEASGIGIACVAGLVFGVPVVFAKKSKSRNVSDDVYTAEVPSFTHGGVNTVQVSREYLHAEDRILIIDKGHTIAEGTVDELKGMIKKSEIITIEVAGLDDKTLNMVREVKNVYSVSYENNTLKIEAGSGKHNVIDIVNMLQDKGYKMKKIFSEQPTLNDVFLELTGKQLRDE